MVTAVLSLFFLLVPMWGHAQSSVQGTLTANGETVELPHVYIWPEKEGFYDPADPTWNILFVEREIAEHEIGDTVWDSAWVHIGITRTKEFEEQGRVEVYMQSIRFSAEAGGNSSGGNYPQIEVEGLDSEQISGRIWHTETQEIFDDKYEFDFTFSAPVSDPDAPIGDLLPEGGGEPGQAYLAWVETVHSGDVDALKAIVPAEMAAQLSEVSEEVAMEEMEFMKAMTPTDVTILGGSSNGEMAIMQIKGAMEGETIKAEVEMTKMGEFWMPTNFSM